MLPEDGEPAYRIVQTPQEVELDPGWDVTVYDVNNEWLRRDPSTRTRGQSVKLEKRGCRSTMGQHCFSNRMINNWNTLPSVNSFESWLDQHWYKHIHSTKRIEFE